MKKVYFLLAVLLLTSFTVKEPVSLYNLPEAGSPVRLELKTAEDKAFLLDYLGETSDKLLESIEGLSDAQMQFKPAPDRWSVSQCLEHIILTEKSIFGMIQKLVKEPANPERRKEIKTTDQDIINGVSERNKKVKTSEEFQPKGTYSGTSDAVQAFTEQRDQVIEYVKNTPLKDLRDHVTDSPLGAIDAYQFLAFAGAHCARHTKQIEEIKADPGFPVE